MQPQPLGIRFDEECGLTGEVFMGKITKDPLMSPSKMLYLPSQGSSGVVIAEELLGVRSTYISITYLREKEQRLHALSAVRRLREGRRGVRVTW